MRPITINKRHLMESYAFGRRSGLGGYLNRTLKVLVAGCVAVMLMPVASAQKFPERPLRLVVPYSTGGATDTVARLVARHMEKALGQPIVVENKTGAGGTIGTGEVARSDADGYTLLFGNVTTAVLNQFLYKQLPFDSVNDFQGIAHIAAVPNVLIINKDVPAQNLQELIAYLRANPGKLSYGTAGNGTVMHLSTELFKRMTDADIQHIPFKGSLPAMQELMAGRLVLMFDNIPGPMGLIRSERVRPIGVSSAERVPALPDLPTLSEAGLPEFKNASWFALFTRSGVDPEVLKTLEKAALEAINQPEVISRLEDLGALHKPMGAEELEAFWQAELEYWKPIVEAANLTLD